MSEQQSKGAPSGWPAKTVGSILKTKGNQVWSVGPDTSVFDALALMGEKNLGAVLVLEGGKIAGIFSERDYARKIILKGKASKDTPVRDIMTPRILCVTPATTVDQCLALMTGKRVRHLPVCDGDRLEGMISIGDVVKEVISGQEFIISQLETYIQGR